VKQQTSKVKAGSISVGETDFPRRENPVPKVLCVFENLLFFHLIGEDLEKNRDLLVDSSVSADGALHLMRYVPFDAIVTDCTQWNGEQHGFLKRLREENASIPFIYFCQEADAQSAGDCRYPGVHFISRDEKKKGEALEELQCTLQKALARGPLQELARPESSRLTITGITRKIAVLHVDDEPAILEITRTFLEARGGVSVNSQVSAWDALELLKREHYDIIISDFQMPGIDGLTFLKTVRATFGDIPFILFTGISGHEIIADARKYGADSYLQKGGSAASLFSELDHQVRQAVYRKRGALIPKKNGCTLPGKRGDNGRDDWTRIVPAGNRAE
jgi:CheY-like chemotaxis protein